MPAPTTTDPTALRRELLALLDRRRERTLQLVASLTDDDVHRQHVDFLSPVVWDVGHIGNFEELWLLRQLDGRAPTDAALDQLYNPFETPRWIRGELPVLDRDAALPYLANVRAEVADLLARHPLTPDEPLVADGFVYRMISQHEAQHQETILQALDLRTDLAPSGLFDPRGDPAPDVDDATRIVVPAGVCDIGTDDRRWAYDNERPRHTRDLATFTIDRYPVTNRRYAAFVADAGYDRPERWSVDGQAWLAETGERWPQAWSPRDAGGWQVRRLGHLIDLDPAEPVQHVNFHEAEAFAAWTGGRLPTEFEWEKAAAWDPATGRSRTYPWGENLPTPDRANVGLARFGPRPVGSTPAGASAYGVEQMIGDVYAWTTSPFHGYPGYTTFPYPGYSEVFLGDDYRVLRGASWAIAASLARATYRNWDYAKRRQIFAGIRVVYDGEVA